MSPNLAFKGNIKYPGLVTGPKSSFILIQQGWLLSVEPKQLWSMADKFNLWCMIRSIDKPCIFFFFWPDVLAKSRVQEWHKISFFILIMMVRQSKFLAERSSVLVINSHVRPNLSIWLLGLCLRSLVTNLTLRRRNLPLRPTNVVQLALVKRGQVLFGLDFATRPRRW